jgi:hypothetical protein
MSGSVTRYNLLFLLGAIVVIVFGLLAALVPALAYVTVHSYFLDISPAPILPSVTYHSFDFSVHAATAKFLLCTLGGIMGLFFLQKRARFYAVFNSVALITIGLLLPIDSVVLGIPEARSFDVP